MTLTGKEKAKLKGLAHGLKPLIQVGRAGVGEPQIKSIKRALHEHELDYTSVLRIARAVREQIDWPALRARTSSSPFAVAFFVMCEELGIVPSDARGVRGADVRVLTPRRQ